MKNDINQNYKKRKMSTYKCRVSNIGEGLNSISRAQPLYGATLHDEMHNMLFYYIYIRH